MGNLAQLPEGCENVFIRAVLTEWFLSNASNVESANRLVEHYLTIEFRNEVGIKFGAHADLCLQSPITTLPADHGVGKTDALERTSFYSERQDRLLPAREVLTEIPVTTAPPLVRPLTLQSASPVALEVDFDPHQF